MKNVFKIFLFLFVMLTIASCSSQIQKDAKEVAKMTCEFQELARQELILTTTMKNDEAKEIKVRMNEIDKMLTARTMELMEIYKTDEEQKEFRVAVKKALSKCMK